MIKPALSDVFGWAVIRGDGYQKNLCTNQLYLFTGLKIIPKSQTPAWTSTQWSPCTPYWGASWCSCAFPSSTSTCGTRTRAPSSVTSRGRFSCARRGRRLPALARGRGSAFSSSWPSSISSSPGWRSASGPTFPPLPSPSGTADKPVQERLNRLNHGLSTYKDT